MICKFLFGLSSFGCACWPAGHFVYIFGFENRRSCPRGGTTNDRPSHSKHTSSGINLDPPPGSGEITHEGVAEVTMLHARFSTAATWNKAVYSVYQQQQHNRCLRSCDTREERQLICFCFLFHPASYNRNNASFCNVYVLCHSEMPTAHHYHCFRSPTTPCRGLTIISINTNQASNPVLMFQSYQHSNNTFLDQSQFTRPFLVVVVFLQAPVTHYAISFGTTFSLLHAFSILAI